MKIYLICPVRNITQEQKNEIDQYVDCLEHKGHLVHYPPRDVNQGDKKSFDICCCHQKAMEKCDIVHIFWDIKSMGSHFDLGMAFALNKRMKLVKTYYPDVEGKSFIKVIKECE